MINQLIDYKLYLITDRKLFQTVEKFVMAVDEALRAGVKAVQLREKDLPTREILKLAYRFRELTARYNAKLFINDRFDIALCIGADGVHLGQSGIPARAVRDVVKERLLIGCSTHSLKEALEAEEGGADFITFGPLFRTRSKMKYGDPVGLELLLDAKQRVALPIFGIGGIKPDDIENVLNSGAYGIALISGILAEHDKAAAAREYLKKVGEL